jgi:hypothetical protein
MRHGIPRLDYDCDRKLNLKWGPHGRGRPRLHVDARAYIGTMTHTTKDGGGECRRLGNSGKAES